MKFPPYETRDSVLDWLTRDPGTFKEKERANGIAVEAEAKLRRITKCRLLTVGFAHVAPALGL